MNNTIRRFKTKNFSVVVTAEEEQDIDLSFDDDGSIQEGIENGKFQVFCVKAACYFHGMELAVDYLGNCIYETPGAFMDHIGMDKHNKETGHNCGSYFSDMVRNVCRDGRKAMETIRTTPIRKAV